jgi:hypothetical protein
MSTFFNITDHCIVIPAKAGIHLKLFIGRNGKIDSRLRGNDSLNIAFHSNNFAFHSNNFAFHSNNFAFQLVLLFLTGSKQ